MTVDACAQKAYAAGYAVIGVQYGTVSNMLEAARSWWFEYTRFGAAALNPGSQCMSLNTHKFAYKCHTLFQMTSLEIV